MANIYTLDDVQMTRMNLETSIGDTGRTDVSRAFNQGDIPAKNRLINRLKSKGFHCIKQYEPLDGGFMVKIISVDNPDDITQEVVSQILTNSESGKKLIKGWNSAENMRKERDAALAIIERRISLEHGDGTISRRPEIYKGTDDLPSDLSEFKSFAYVRIAKAKSEHYKKYIGETIDYDKRTNTIDYTSGPFGKVWKEQGDGGFLNIIICCYGEQDARLLEQALIVKFDTRNPNFGYNVR